MIRALALVAALAGVVPAADARGYHYRDGRGFRHWCLSSCGKHHFARHRHATRAPERYSVFITKLPPDDEPVPAAVTEERKPESRIPKSENNQPSPYGVLVQPRAVPVELFKPKGAQ